MTEAIYTLAGMFIIFLASIGISIIKYIITKKI